MDWEQNGLSAMRYGNFVWPHNPRVYSIEYERVMASHKIPFGDYVLQDLGRVRRVMRGEGEFVGADAYRNFGMLANCFYQGGTDWLIHPLWQPAQAFFVDLKLEQIPCPDYVRYSFTFWEDIDVYDKEIAVVETSSSSGTVSEGTKKVHIVVSGDCMWTIARDYGLNLGDLIGLNPQIKNPNLIYAGDEVYLA